MAVAVGRRLITTVVGLSSLSLPPFPLSLNFRLGPHGKQVSRRPRSSFFTSPVLFLGLPVVLRWGRSRAGAGAWCEPFRRRPCRLTSESGLGKVDQLGTNTRPRIRYHTSPGKGDRRARRWIPLILAPVLVVLVPLVARPVGSHADGRIAWEGSSGDSVRPGHLDVYRFSGGPSLTSSRPSLSTDPSSVYDDDHGTWIMVDGTPPERTTMLTGRVVGSPRGEQIPHRS